MLAAASGRAAERQRAGQSHVGPFLIERAQGAGFDVGGHRWQRRRNSGWMGGTRSGCEGRQEIQ
jgi:hypothetical protein